MDDPLLELPAVGLRLAGLDLRELGLRFLELRARPRLVDLERIDRVVDERDRRSCSTLKKPGPVANSWMFVSLTCTRTEPAFSVAISGACRASTPISPAAPGTISSLASPSNAAPSGVTSETEKLLSESVATTR